MVNSFARAYSQISLIRSWTQSFFQEQIALNKPLVAYIRGMVREPPDIFSFDDYRKFLRERYLFLKLNDRKFSHRYINQKLGLKSSGWFGDVLAGRHRIKPGQVKSIATVFKIGPDHQKCLRAMVEVESAETPEELAQAYEKWVEAKGVPSETVDKDRFRFYDRWYFSVLRELLSLRPDLRDPEALATMLDPKITPNQAKEALHLLVRLGLLDGPQSAAGNLAPALVKDASARTRHWKKMMASMMKLGRRALDKYDRDQRNFSGLTLTFSPEGLQKAGEEIAALRKRLLYLSQRDRRSDRVFHCLFQIYPVTAQVEANRG
jgi:uncharacterized protein (TIGR02147 family)